MRKKFFIFAAFSLLSLLGLTKAADINVNLPNVPPAQDNPGAWIGGFYQFSLMLAGLLAFGMIVYAGLRYTYAAGNPSTQSDARDQILQALLGLLLLFGAYIVLFTINPNIVNLEILGLKKIEGQPGVASAPACNNQTSCYRCGNNPTCWADQNSCRAACSAPCVATGACPTP